VLFGIMLAGRVYLRTNAVTVHEYKRRGMRPLHAGARVLEAYYEVPPEVLHDRRRLPQWCEAAARCAEARCAAGAAREEVRRGAPGLAPGVAPPGVQPGAECSVRLGAFPRA
jgi:TfoX/Sxy family transcriptional regulator of competence genes